MSVIRRRDKFGREIIVGAGYVAYSKNGEVLEKSVAKTGRTRYSVKVIIATIPYQEKGGKEIKYQRKTVTLYAWSNNIVCAELIKNLQYGDDVFFFGKIDNQEFETGKGKIMKSFQISIEYLTVYGRYKKAVKQGQPNADTTEQTEEFDEEYPF